MNAQKNLSPGTIVILKVINNNIVSSIDSDGREMIVTGRGIGFGKRAGGTVEPEKIDKFFKLDNQDLMEKFKELLVQMPLEYIQVSNDIISYAKEVLDAGLNQNVYLTLTDHIGFVISKHKVAMEFPNALHEEVKLFYPKEYSVGVYALHLIETRTGERLRQDEAASIALHLVNAELNTSISHTFTMTRMIHEMMEMIEWGIALKPDDSYQRDRLIINLKLLGNRMLVEDGENGYVDEVLRDFVKSHCAVEYELVNKVNDYINEHYRCVMTDEESIYLTLNVKQIKDFFSQNRRIAEA